MATSSTSSQNKPKNSSGSEEVPQQVVDIRKRKRMLSNRESARRSRQRKQQHLDNLTAQANQLNTQNSQIVASTNTTTELYLNVESENSILRAQLDELTNRLNSLNDIIRCLTATPVDLTTSESEGQESFDGFDFEFDDGLSMNPWGFSLANWPIMASTDAFMC